MTWELRVKCICSDRAGSQIKKVVRIQHAVKNPLLHPFHQSPIYFFGRIYFPFQDKRSSPCWNCFFLFTLTFSAMLHLNYSFQVHPFHQTSIYYFGLKYFPLQDRCSPCWNWKLDWCSFNELTRVKAINSPRRRRFFLNWNWDVFLVDLAILQYTYTANN